MKKIIVLSTLFVLSACTQYKWIKPGQTDLDMHKQVTACQASALTSLPPDNVVYGSRSSGYEEKDGKRTDGKKDKNRQYDRYSESTVNDISDANIQHRDVLIRDCMFRNGWNEIVISN